MASAQLLRATRVTRLPASGCAETKRIRVGTPPRVPSSRYHSTKLHRVVTVCAAKQQSKSSKGDLDADPLDADPLGGFDVQEEIQSYLQSPEVAEAVNEAAATAAKLQNLKGKKLDLEIAELKAQVEAEKAAPNVRAKEADKQVLKAAERYVELSEKLEREKAAMEEQKAALESSQWMFNLFGVGAESEEGSGMDSEMEEVQRVESGKAAVVAAAGGLLCSAPLVLLQASGAVTAAADLGVAVLSCALFGVTYRYAVREDLNYTQLKGGVVGAFGVVHGLGKAEVLVASAGLSVETGAEGALAVLQSLVMFGFAWGAVEVALRNGFLAPFPPRASSDSSD